MKTRVFLAITTTLFLALVATLLSYFYAVTPYTVDAGGTRRGWPLVWVTYWWSSWTMPPSYGIVYDLPSFMLDFFFWLAIFLIPQVLFFAHKSY